MKTEELKYKAEDENARWDFYLSVILISMSALMLEINLTRIFSVMFEYNYVFLFISVAILGLGAGGIYVHNSIEKFSDRRFYQKILPVSSGLMALSILGITISIVKIPFLHHVLFAATLTFFPFFFGGIFLAVAFRLFADRSPQIYAADLIGASIGSFLVVPFLKMGGINVNLLVAFIAALPAGLIISGKSLKKVEKGGSFFLIACLLAIFLVNHFSAFLGKIPFSRAAQKSMAHILDLPITDARVIDSRWSAFGRTDLVADGLDPDEMALFVDGNAGTSMHRFDGDLKGLDRPKFTHFSGYFPFELLSEREKEKVLIIGSGGGREVLIALLGGAKEITAVEVNRDLVELMKKYSDFNGGIYNGFPGVKVFVEEGRNFVRRAKESYDIIMLVIPVTKSGRSPDGFALTENFLFTVESINDYLDRLRPDGRLIVVAHEDLEIFRLIFTSLAALKKRGIDTISAMKHIYTVGSELFPVFVLKKSPLTPEEAQNVHLNMHEYGYSSHSSFIPFIEQEKHYIPAGEEKYRRHDMLNQSLYFIAQGLVYPEELIRVFNYEIRAVTDDDPFFYRQDPGIPPIIVFVLVISSIALIFVCLSRPGYEKEGQRPKHNITFLLLFSFLGIGFMLIEISLIQKFILFLGQPVYSIAVLLFSILIGAGIGSWVSGFFWMRGMIFKLRLASMMVGLLVGICILFLNQVFDLFLGTPFFYRIVISSVLLLPLGFFMGMPFPLGMKLLKEMGFAHYVPRMWGINGIGSVLGSAMAIALAISFGFSYAMTLGAILYFSIFIFFSIGFRVPKAGTE